MPLPAVAASLNLTNIVELWRTVGLQIYHVSQNLGCGCPTPWNGLGRTVSIDGNIGFKNLSSGAPPRPSGGSWEWIQSWNSLHGHGRSPCQI